MYAAILVVSTLTLFVIEMLLNLDDMLSNDRGAAAPLQYLMLRIPTYYLRELIPIASFAAAFFTLGLSTQWFEIAAAKAGDISPDRIVAPILIASVFLGLASFVLGETWIVNSLPHWAFRSQGDATSGFPRCWDRDSGRIFALRSVGTTLAGEGVISAATATGSLLLLFTLAGTIQMRFIER